MYKRIFKRIFDIMAAILVIVILLPFWIVLISLIAFSNKGKVFFLQERPGLNGNLFKVVKFITMNERRDTLGRLLPDKDRITPVGKVIRSLSLDELPQLINIIKGDMSLVGPRPLLVKYLPLYDNFQIRRHEVRPGITGWAQINGRNAISWQQKFEYDVWYVDNVSLSLDIKIILMTMKKVILREGINAGAEVTMEEFKGNAE